MMHYSKELKKLNQMNVHLIFKNNCFYHEHDYKFYLPPHFTRECPGKNGAKCFLTPIGPIPGPPPP